MLTPEELDGKITELIAELEDPKAAIIYFENIRIDDLIKEMFAQEQP